jgi:hypothetical protein
MGKQRHDSGADNSRRFMTIFVDAFSCSLRLEAAAREETAPPRLAQSTVSFSRAAR